MTFCIASPFKFFLSRERALILADKTTVFLFCEFVIFLPVSLPRYVRVNTLKATVADVVERLCEDGYRQISVLGCDFEQ